MKYSNTFPEPALPPPSVEEMARAVIQDISEHFHFNTDTWRYALLHKLAMIPARNFMRLLRACDIKVATQSLWEAARDLLPRFSGGWEVTGFETVPKTGPLLVVSNHPGAVDSIAALALLERQDVNLLAFERPTLKVLPNTSEHLYYMDEHNPTRIDIMRGLIQLLARGKAVVIFPRGTLEPDPARYPGALESVKHWSESLGVFLSRVPETRLQVILTRNVLTPQAWNHPLARLGKTLRQRHQIGMILQGAVQQFFGAWKIPVRVSLPEAVPARTLSRDLDPREINRELKRYVAGEMEKTFENL